jgi:hypothetical protein
VTLPFHPLAGQRLQVLGRQRSARGVELDCDGGRLGRVRLPAAWTDQVPAEPGGRISTRVLTDLVAAMTAIEARHAG